MDVSLDHTTNEPRGYRVRYRSLDGRWIAEDQDTGDVQVFNDRDAARRWAEQHNRVFDRA